MGVGFKGLTLAELVVAIGLLAAIGLTLIGLFSQLLSSSAKNSDLTAGRLFAQRVLDRAVRSGPPDWGVGSGLYAGGAAITTQDQATQTTFVYSLTPALLKRDTGITGTSRELYFVEVEVAWWQTGGSPNREGIGRLFTTTGQSVYVER